MRADRADAEFLMSARAPAGGARRRFAAGEAVLAIDAPARERDGVVGVLEDAMLLGDCDELLRRVAHGCGEDLAWAPSPPAAAGGDGAADEPFDFTVGRVGERRGRVAVRLPEPLRERLAATLLASPPAATGTRSGGTEGEGPETGVETGVEAGDGRGGEHESEHEGDPEIRIVAHRPTLWLELDRFALDPDDAARLGDGALLLLPGSFDARWRGAFGPRDAPATLPVTLDALAGAATPAPPTAGGGAAATTGGTAAGRDAPVEGVRCSVRLERAWSVPLGRWSSGAAKKPPLPLELPDGTPLTVRVESVRPARVDDPGDSGDPDDADDASPRSLTGELVALRRGFAVLLGSDPWT